MRGDSLCTAGDEVRMKTLCSFSSPIVNLPVVTLFSCVTEQSSFLIESLKRAQRTLQNRTSFWIAAFSGSTFAEKATLPVQISVSFSDLPIKRPGEVTHLLAVYSCPQ